MTAAYICAHGAARPHCCHPGTADALQSPSWVVEFLHVCAWPCRHAPSDVWVAARARAQRGRRGLDEQRVVDVPAHDHGLLHTELLGGIAPSQAWRRWRVSPKANLPPHNTWAHAWGAAAPPLGCSNCQLLPEFHSRAMQEGVAPLPTDRFGGAEISAALWRMSP